jgi:hypothetical protein
LQVNDSSLLLIIQGRRTEDLAVDAHHTTRFNSTHLTTLYNSTLFESQPEKSTFT